jgi:PAB-dependent poly(A)-specific ribonuclease subunit 2
MTQEWEFSNNPNAGICSSDHVQGEAVASSCNSEGYVLSRFLISAKIIISVVPDAEERTDLRSPWFVFNDFVVRNVSEEEALSFPGKWKVCESVPALSQNDSYFQVPAVIYLERIDKNRPILDLSGLPDEIDLSILSRDTSISAFVFATISWFLLTVWSRRNRDVNIIKHQCLRFDELPKPGTLVAIDAEFVQMQQVHTSIG